MKPSNNNPDVFIWTEALGCGEILPPMLNSFLHHHNFQIHVIGYKNDLLDIPTSSNIRPIILDEVNEKQNLDEIGTTESEMKTAYELGHHGTATLWASLITNRDEKFLIHLDSDTIFLGDVVSPIIECLRKGKSIVGTRRPYRYRASGKTVRSRVLHHFQRDAVNTHAFGFDRECLNLPKERLIELINGNAGSRVVNYIFPVIDFFDRITFYLSRSRRIYYLDSQKQGRSGKHNYEGVFESKMISFAAVGSGYAFFHGYANSPSPSYKKFAVSSYALYAKHFLGKDIGVPLMESPYLESLLMRLDTNNWRLSQEGREK
jgi:hypothetical protein